MLSKGLWSGHQEIINLILHSRTMHIEVKYLFIREHVQDGNVDIQYVSTEEQLRDLFKKPLAFD